MNEKEKTNLDGNQSQSQAQPAVSDKPMPHKSKVLDGTPSEKSSRRNPWDGADNGESEFGTRDTAPHGSEGGADRADGHQSSSHNSSWAERNAKAFNREPSGNSKASTGDDN